MQENDKPVLIYTTFPDALSAERAGETLVNDGLAACINIIPGMTSIYRWQGSVSRANEVVMIVKTRSGLATTAMDAIARLHPHKTPAQLILAIEGGAAPYLEWLMSSTTGA